MQPGEILGERFVIEHLAGEGGMGAVYRATDRASGQPVAVKVLQAHSTAADRFVEEARMLAELAHPAIVRHVAHGARPNGEMFLAMEWLEGEDLADRLGRSPLTLSETLSVAHCVATGLAAAHKRGIVHRDIKPSNLFLVGGDPGNVKVLDFGVARPIARSRVVTSTGAMLGTIGYMAPEQAVGSQELDARADVFALGCVLFECVTGQPAFSGEHIVAILAKVLREEAPRLCDLMPHTSWALDDLVGRMLAKDKSNRPTDGSAVVRELEHLGEIAIGGKDTTPRVMTRREQRIVNVILAELDARVSVLAATMVPEQMADDLARMEQLVRPFGGDVAQLANGTFLVTLAGRSSATDAAAEAAALTLALRDAHPHAAIALATGRAETTGVVPVGPAIDRAAALLRQRISGIRIDDVTAKLLDTRFDVATADGFAVLAGKREGMTGARTLLGKPTPCVGREKELALLHATIAESSADMAAHAVLVTAPPGAGKSRLVFEAVRGARSAHETLQVLHGRADALSAGSAFAVVAQMIRHSAGIAHDEASEAKLEKIRARVARHVPVLERPRTSELLAELADVHVPESEASPVLVSARRDPALMGEALRAALCSFLAAECDAGPVLLVLEDLHWADEPSIKLVGAVLRALREKPLTVLAAARPEVHTVFPQLWSESSMQEIRLGALSKKSSERLARAVLGPSARSEIIATVVERAAGSPFFLEELLRAVVEGGDARVLPETVLGMLQARLDALGPDAKRVLRAASILGQAFSPEAIAALLGGESDVHDCMRDLVAKEIFEAALHGGQELTFRHALLRDAAYATLTDVDRVLGHRLAGEWLESRSDDERPDILAHHFSQAGLWAKAFRHGRKAAARAARLSRFSEALTLLEQARGWLLALPEDEARREMLVELLLEQERLCDNIGARDRQQTLIDSLVALLHAEHDRVHLATVLVRQAELFTQVGRVADGFQVLGRALELSQSAGDPEAERAALRSLAFLCWQTGRDEEAVSYNEQVLALGSSNLGHGRDLIHLAMCLRRLGRLDRARACLEESMKYHRDPKDETHALHVRANLYGELGDVDNQLSSYERALEIQERHGVNISLRLITMAGMGSVLCRTGKIDEGLEVYRELVRLAREADVRPHLGRSLGIIGEVLVGLGRDEDALPYLIEAAAILETIGEPAQTAATWDLLAAAYEPLPGGMTRATDAWAHAADFWRQAGNDAHELRAIEGAARTARKIPDETLAIRHYEAAIRLAVKIDQTEKEADLLNSLAILHFGRGEYEGALACYERALAIFSEKGDDAHRGLVLNSMGATLERLGRPDEAIPRLELAVTVNHGTGERLLEGHSLALLGNVHRSKGEPDVARAYYERSLDLRRAIGDRTGEGWMLHYLGVIEAAKGDRETARALLESSTALAERDSELSVACRRILDTLG